MTGKMRVAAVLVMGMALAVPAVARKIKPVAPPPPAAPERVTSVEGITEYRLHNGLRVLLFPDQSKQTITVNVTYLVGSRHENYGETGMAHLLEHLVFKGSTRHPDIAAELTAHGARPNGTTSWDRTNYFETFNATEENLRWALDLEADRMVNSFIAKKDLDSEMTVVRNEFEMGENNPVGVLFKRVLSVAYDWHNYGNMPIGARSDIESVPAERLQAFYRTYYQPDNAILLIAGKIDEAKTLALVQEYFSPIPKPARTLPTLHTVEPVQDGVAHGAARRLDARQVDERDDGEPIARHREERRRRAVRGDQRMVLDRHDHRQLVGAGSGRRVGRLEDAGRVGRREGGPIDVLQALRDGGLGVGDTDAESRGDQRLIPHARRSGSRRTASARTA